MKRVVVLGGGFAGVEATIKLKALGYDVTLVSDRDYLFVYPIAIWIPVKKTTFENAQINLSKLQNKHKFDLIISSVAKIDAENKIVYLMNRQIDYDYLFIAMGMNKVKTKGLEHTLTICGNPEGSIRIQEELYKLINKGSGKIAIGFGGNPKDSTASTVRGGPAFELMFNISNSLKEKGIRDNFEINFFAPMTEPGKKMGEKAFQKLDSFYERYKINRFIGKKIIEFEKNTVVFEDNSKLESDLIIYISGGAGHSVINESSLPMNDAGFIKINEYCQVEGYEDVYAIGDIAEITGTEWIAKQGHMAEMMADVAVSNFHNSIIGKESRKSYKDHISIICLMDSGDGAAWVSRTIKKDSILLLPIVGHWLKKAWGFYYKNSKLKRIPRIPGF